MKSEEENAGDLMKGGEDTDVSAYSASLEALLSEDGSSFHEMLFE